MPIELDHQSAAVAVLEPVEEVHDPTEAEQPDPLIQLRARLYEQALFASERTGAEVDDVFPIMRKRGEVDGVQMEEAVYSPDHERFLVTWLALKTGFLVAPDDLKKMPDLTQDTVLTAYDLKDNDELLDTEVPRFDRQGIQTMTTIGGLVGDLNAYSSRLRTMQDARVKLKSKQKRTGI